jgi:SPP1 family predicted phage head-tail adaptor
MIRYRPNITTAMRILYGTRTFNIIKISDENDNNNYITIEAIENVGT